MTFCDKYHQKILLASTETICLYVACLSKSMECSSVSTYVSALSSLHNLQGFPSPNLGHFSIRLALAGLKLQRLEAPNAKVGISLGYLSAIFCKLDLVSHHCRAVIWCACAIAFYSLLRKTNLFFGPKNKHFLRVKLKQSLRKSLLGVLGVTENDHWLLFCSIFVAVLPPLLFSLVFLRARSLARETKIKIPHVHVILVGIGDEVLSQNIYQW